MLTIGQLIQMHYNVVRNYCIKRATCIDRTLHDRAFKKHVPYKTKDFFKCWGRDRWAMFDGLPLEYRDILNNEHVLSDEDLITANEMWEAEIKEAEKSMDYIIQVEQRSSLASVFTNIPCPEQVLIDQLKAERLKLYEEQLAANKKLAKEQADKKLRMTA